MIGHTVIQRTLWCWALLLTLAIGACAASLTGQAQENGGTWELSWTLRSEKSIPRNTNLIAPDFEGFRVLAGPSISTSVNLINGRSSNERTWTYVLMPLKAGDVSVSPARVQYDGTTLSSRPLKIRAAAPGQSAGSGSRKIFLRAELSDTEAVVGQELVLNWVLYFNSNVNSYEPPRIDRLPGFLVQELEPVRQPEIEQRDLDGQTWNSAVIGRCLLYPTRSGELTLEPATATVSVPAQKARRSRDPFGSLFDSPVFDRNERLNLASDVVTLKVSDLPPGAPAGFSGAVGVYRMQAEPDRNSLAAGEALTMTVTLSGRGNVGMLQAPELVLSPDFERYDTRRPKKACAPAKRACAASANSKLCWYHAPLASSASRPFVLCITIPTRASTRCSVRGPGAFRSAQANPAQEARSWWVPPSACAVMVRTSAICWPRRSASKSLARR